MRVGIAADHAMFALKEQLTKVAGWVQSAERPGADRVVQIHQRRESGSRRAGGTARSGGDRAHLRLCGDREWDGRICNAARSRTDSYLFGRRRWRPHQLAALPAPGESLSETAARRALDRWHPYGGLIYFHVLLDRLSEEGFLPAEASLPQTGLATNR